MLKGTIVSLLMKILRSLCFENVSDVDSMALILTRKIIFFIMLINMTGERACEGWNRLQGYDTGGSSSTLQG